MGGHRSWLVAGKSLGCDFPRNLPPTKGSRRAWGHQGGPEATQSIMPR